MLTQPPESKPTVQRPAIRRTVVVEPFMTRASIADSSGLVSRHWLPGESLLSRCLRPSQGKSPREERRSRDRRYPRDVEIGHSPALDENGHQPARDLERLGDRHRLVRAHEELLAPRLLGQQKLLDRGGIGGLKALR